MYRPYHLISRQFSQAAWFTIHQPLPNQGKYFDLTQINDDELQLTKIVLPREVKGAVLKTLMDIGVTKYSIFGDLDSLGETVLAKRLRSISW